VKDKSRPKQPEISVPLHNQETEQVILGTVLLDSSTLDEIAEILGSEDFFREQHRLIYRSMLALRNDGQPVDAITVMDHLKAKNELDKAGGGIYLAQLAGSVVTIGNIRQYAETVRGLAIRRKLAVTCMDIAGSAYDQSADLQTILDKAQSDIFALTAGADKSGPVLLADVIANRLDYLYSTRDKADEDVVFSGFVDLDNMTGGFTRGSQVIIAGRPSMGKSAFGLQLAMNAAKKGKTVVFFSMEMRPEEIADRVVAMQVPEIDTLALRRRLLDEQGWDKALQVMTLTGAWQLYLDCSPVLTTSQIASRCRQLKTQHGLDMVIVDYLTYLSDQPDRITQSRNDLVGQMAKRLKQAAGELDAVMVVLAQLNRAVEATADKKPNKAHLRDSGEIEAHADYILFLYREEYYFPDREAARGVAEIIVDKQRNGPTGVINLWFDKQKAKFADLAKEGVHFGWQG
jgi:replicative DNA helicase